MQLSLPLFLCEIGIRFLPPAQDFVSITKSCEWKTLPTVLGTLYFYLLVIF